MKCTEKPHFSQKAREMGHPASLQIEQDVIPEDLWYIFPAATVEEMRYCTYLFPSSPDHKHEKYREAWELLRAAVKAEAPPVIEEEGPAEEQDSVIAGEAVDMRAEVETPAVGFDRNVVRSRLAACFERMRK